MSNYFSYLPDVFVRTSTYRQNNVDPFIKTKNLFRRVKVREDIEGLVTGFTQYTIVNNERPDNVSEKFYSDPQYDWVVLMTNNITNIYDEWPMTEDELYKYCVSTYSSPEDIHHYETFEVKDTKGNTVLRAGLTIPPNFTYRRPDGTTVATDDLVHPVTNYEFEAAKNDFKRNIYILRKPYLTTFLEEFQTLVEYEDSREVDSNTGVKKTSDAIKENFIPVKPTYSTNIGQTSSVDFAVQQDFGNITVDTSGATIEEGQQLADGSTTVTTTESSTSTNAASSNSAITETASNTTDSSSSSSSSSSSGSSGSSGSSQGGYGGY